MSDPATNTSNNLIVLPSSPAQRAVQLGERATQLRELIKTFKKWLHLPDTGALETALGTYAANRLAGDPVWVLLVGSSSSGKGAILDAFQELPYMHKAAEVSEASLISGTSRKDKSKLSTGGMLKQMEPFGIFHMKDFTSMFTKNKEERAKALSVLRHVYDGYYDRPVGADGGRMIHFKGKAGLIGGVTGRIDSEHATMGELGPRFLLFRMPHVENFGSEHIRMALNRKRTGDLDSMRAELMKAVEMFFRSCDFRDTAAKPTLNEEQDEWLMHLSIITATWRSSVGRESSSKREIDNIQDPEVGIRLGEALGQLLIGLRYIGVPVSRQYQLVQKIGLDSIPPIRRVLYDYLADHHHAYVADISKTTKYSRQTLVRAVEELDALGAVYTIKGEDDKVIVGMTADMHKQVMGLLLSLSF